MRAFWNLYTASMKEFLRSRMAVFWTLAFPLLLALLFGVVFGGGGDTRFKVGVVDEDGGPAAAQFRQVLDSIPVLETQVGDRESSLAALRQGDVRAVLVLPAGLSAAVAQRQPSPVQIFYDPAQQQVSQIVLGITRQASQAVERQVSGTPVLFELQEETVQAQDLRTIDFLLPGILALALMQIGLFGTAQPMVHLREQGVLRRLSATPLSQRTVLASQVAQRLTMGVAQAALIVLLGLIVFKMPLPSNWLAALGFVILGGLVFVAFGYVIAAFAKTQESASGISSVINFPLIYLSGMFIPLEVMPQAVQPLALIIPVTYLVDALRQVMVGANPLHSQALNAGVLLAWLAVALVIATRFFKWDNVS